MSRKVQLVPKYGPTCVENDRIGIEIVVFFLLCLNETKLGIFRGCMIRLRVDSNHAFATKMKTFDST
jgi:hypothetical protein